jgi:hypothetical protein
MTTLNLILGTLGVDTPIPHATLASGGASSFEIVNDSSISHFVIDSVISKRQHQFIFTQNNIFNSLPLIIPFKTPSIPQLLHRILLVEATPMSEEIPEHLKLKIYRKLMTQISQQKQQAEDPEKIVYSKLADEKAVELMNKLKTKYPDVYRTLVNELYRAIKNNVISEIDGYTLYQLFQTLGLDIKPDLRIKFIKHGKEVDLKDYL